MDKFHINGQFQSRDFKSSLSTWLVDLRLKIAALLVGKNTFFANVTFRVQDGELVVKIKSEQALMRSADFPNPVVWHDKKGNTVLWTD